MNTKKEKGFVVATYKIDKGRPYGTLLTSGAIGCLAQNSSFRGEKFDIYFHGEYYDETFVVHADDCLLLLSEVSVAPKNKKQHRVKLDFDFNEKIYRDFVMPKSIWERHFRIHQDT